MEHYRDNLITTYKYLISVRNDLMTQAINLAMIGELKHIDEAFEIGDTFNFDIEQFKGCKDSNLKEIVALYESLETTMDTLANINAITEEELS